MRDAIREHIAQLEIIEALNLLENAGLAYDSEKSKELIKHTAKSRKLSKEEHRKQQNYLFGEDGNTGAIRELIDYIDRKLQ